MAAHLHQRASEHGSRSIFGKTVVAYNYVVNVNYSSSPRWLESSPSPGRARIRVAYELVCVLCEI